MTVQELIDTLQWVPDKSRTVHTYDGELDVLYDLSGYELRGDLGLDLLFE